MAGRLQGETLRWLEAIDRDGSFDRLDDGTLLEWFLTRPDDSSGLAFETLVRRHGPMVLSTCRAILRDEQAADDAFQATFLVLARRASNIRDCDRLAPWLGRVARRIALRSRAEAARRARFERQAALEIREHGRVVDAEAASLVLAEVARLPETDRRLLRLTYWQGKTYEEAAAVLAWPIGTVRSRLSRVRERLRGRLGRLGLAPVVGFAAWSSRAEGALAASPAENLVLRTVRVATRHAGEMTAAVEAGMVPASVAALVDGELAMMTATPWKSIALVLALGGASTAGVASLALRGSDPGLEAPPIPENPRRPPQHR